MSWKKLGSGYLSKNKRANPQNNLPMFTSDVKIKDDILAGDTVSISLWRNVKYGVESFSISVSMNENQGGENAESKSF